MKHIFLISLLGAFVSVSAMGAVPAGGGAAAGGGEIPAGGGAEVGDELLCRGDKISIQSGYYFPTLDTGSGTKCLAGYYCPSGHFWADCKLRPSQDGTVLLSCDSYFDDRCSSLSSTVSNFNLNKCPDGTTSDAGADSIDDCYPIESPTPSRAPGRIDRNDTNPVCDDTTLGTTSGSTDFEADWTPNTINITWVGNGATVSGGASTCTYDQSFNLPTPPERTGYTFDGWKVVNK